MKLFAKPQSIEDELSKLRRDERNRREDRGIVSAFFNGSPPLSDEEAEELGFTVNVNHLFGHKEIDDAAAQVFGLYHKPATLVEVDLDAAPPGKRIDFGMKASMEASRVFKQIDSFKPHYQGVAGDGSMHGEAVFFYPNRTFPLPKQCPLSKMLIPDDATTDVTELTHFGIEAPFGIKELHWYWKRGGKGWHKENIGKVLRKIYENVLDSGSEIDATNLEEIEYKRQENSARETNSRRRPGVDVTYFYQMRADLYGAPFDLCIKLTPSGGDDSDQRGLVIYEGEACIPSIRSCLHPFFMDCIIGGAPKWHRVLGLGHLNYQTNHAVELLVNRAQQATIEGSMNLWQAKDTATRDAAQQILLKHNGVLPEGLNLVQNRFSPNLGGILEMIQFFRQAGSKNARGVTPNNGDANDQLEVQAMAELNAAATAGGTRTSNWYDHLDRMWTEAFTRLTNPYIDKDELGYSEVMDFQNAMHRAGIPLWYLQPGNVRVRAVRIVGDGLRQKEIAAMSYLTQNRNQYAPEVQPRITRLCTALALDNYRLAEDFTPIQEEQDSPQSARVDEENAVMMTMRRKMGPKVDDVDEIHVMGHFPALELLIGDALQFQKAAFTPQQAEAFQVIGAHIITHIDRIESKASDLRKDPDREKARQMRTQLNSMAAMGEKLVQNMQQMQQGQEQEIDPVEMQRLQLEAEKLSLSRDKLGHAMQKFERTQGTREQAMAFEQMLKLEKDRRDQIKTDRDGETRKIELAQQDVALATKVATAGQRGRRE